MIGFAATGLLVGALLGRQLTVLSLIPAILLCGLFTTATWLFGVGIAIGDVVSLFVGLEVGYLLTAVAEALIRSTASAPQRSAAWH